MAALQISFVECTLPALILGTKCWMLVGFRYMEPLMEKY